MATFTKSRDGVCRASLRIEFRIGREEMVQALCVKASRALDFDDEREERLSRAFILNTVRDILSLDGTSTLPYWADELTEEMSEEIWEWATTVVDTAFPEMGGGA